MQSKSKKLFVKSFALALIVFTPFAVLGSVNAASNSTFNQTINAGTLAIDIVDGSFVSVGSPSVTFPATTFSFNCQNSAATLGTSTQRLYVRNPDSADNGWTASIAGSSATAVWDGASSDYDFNDATGSGCSDGADADSVGGQMTVDPSTASLAVGNCLSCTTTGITLGSSSAFVQGTTDSITLLTASAGSNDIGDWTVEGINISQSIPAEQGAANDYDINMVLSIIAN